MYKLRKRKTYDDLIKDLNNQPIITYPKRQGVNMINNIIISNLLFNQEPITEMKERIIKLNKFTQTPHVKFTQTGILNQETQKPYELQHYDLHPHLYITKLMQCQNI